MSVPSGSAAQRLGRRLSLVNSLQHADSEANADGRVDLNPTSVSFLATSSRPADPDKSSSAHKLALVDRQIFAGNVDAAADISESQLVDERNDLQRLSKVRPRGSALPEVGYEPGLSLDGYHCMHDPYETPENCVTKRWIGDPLFRKAFSGRVVVLIM